MANTSCPLPTTLRASIPLPSSVPPPPTLPFFFRRRTAALNWASVLSLNLDSIIRNVDVSALQHHLDNLCFSTLSAGDLPHLLPSHLLHLFRLQQLTIEYLLHVQSFLYWAHKGREDECEQLAARLVTQREQEAERLRERSRDSKRLKRELSMWKERAEAAEAGTGSGRERRSSSRREAGDGSVFSCSECDAAFISPFYLAGHRQRRHSDSARRRAQQTRAEEEKQPLPSLPQSDADRQRERADWQQQQQSSLRQWQTELQEMMESRLNACFQQEESRREQRLMQRLSSIELKVEQAMPQHDGKSRAEEEAASARVLRAVMEELAALKAETARLIDVREERRKEEEREREAQREAERAAATAREEQREREWDGERERQRELTRKEQAAAELQRKQGEEALRSVYQQFATEAEQRRASVQREAVYPVIPSLPFLLSHFPHTPRTVDGLLQQVGAKVQEAESKGAELEDGQQEDDEVKAPEAEGVKRKVDGLVSRYWSESEDAAVRRDAVDERLRGLGYERERLQRDAEESRQRQAEEEREDAELAEQMRILDRQKADVEREREQEARRRTEEETKRREEELRREVEREVRELKREQVRQEERQREEQRERQRLQLEREEREEEERWRREEQERQAEKARQLHAMSSAAAAPVRSLSPVSSSSSSSRLSPPPPAAAAAVASLPQLNTGLSRQQSSPSLATPAFTTHQSSPSASPWSRNDAQLGVGQQQPERSPAAFTLQEKDEDGAGDDWEWEQEDDAAERKEAERAASDAVPLERKASEEQEEQSLRSLLGRGAAGGGGSSGASVRAVSTLAERKAMLLERGFGLMRLQTPQQREEEAAAKRRQREEDSRGRQQEEKEEDDAPSPALAHTVTRRPRPASAQRRQAAGPPLLSPFRAANAAAAPPSSSALSAGSWDD